jgi:A/G-specific adenine glycosylase
MPKSVATAAVVASTWTRRLAPRLIAWYRRHRRDLPWRSTGDAYAVWVSEIMLQQTQVATVVPYYLRFLREFPTVQALADADERRVLRMWEGLGYYRRARQMHRAARIVVDTHGGEFPSELAAIRSLPGIGRYTAGAIVSIAYDRPAPILEANTVRLLSRLVAFPDDPTSAAGQRLLWQVAEAVLPRRNCREFNQALMELGSLVCTPHSPGCSACPLEGLCKAHASGQVAQIPKLRRKPPGETVHEAAVVVWRNDKVLLQQRAAHERWAGLWDFLRFAVNSRGTAAAVEREVLKTARASSGLSLHSPVRLTTLKHGVTRFRITLDCYSVRCAPGRARLTAGEWQWVRPAQLESYPLSVTGRKLGRLLIER